MRKISREALKRSTGRVAALALIILLAGCGALTGGDAQFRDGNMDFASIKSVAVMPLANLSREPGGAERVRDVLSNMLLATGSMYVVPPGEVARGILQANMANPSAPSVEEAKKLASVIHVNAVVTGVLREFGEVRSGSVSANTISLSLQLVETQTGKVVWSASTTVGGISALDRLFGGGGKPMNEITEKAVNDLIDVLFK